MEFKKKLKTRLYTAIIYVVLGLLMIISSFIFKDANSFVSSFGFALFIVGIVRLRNYFIITKSEESIKKQEIAETDERNLSILHKARSTTFSIYVLIMSLAVIVLSFLGFHTVAMWISLSIWLLIAIYWICYFIYRKKM